LNLQTLDSARGGATESGWLEACRAGRGSEYPAYARDTPETACREIAAAATAKLFTGGRSQDARQWHCLSESTVRISVWNSRIRLIRAFFVGFF